MGNAQAVLLAVLFCLPLHSADRLVAGRRLPGVVVESASVEPGMATGAGIRSYALAPGDILESYSCDGKPQPIDSPLDMPKLDVARFACKHEVVLSGRRNGIATIWRVSQGDWNVQVGPRFEGPDEQLYKTGVELAKSGKREEAVQEWTGIQRPETWWPWWRELHSAALFAADKEWNKSDELFDKALALIPPDNHVWKAEAFFLWAETFAFRDDNNNAEQRYRKSLEADDSEIPQLRKVLYQYRLAESLLSKGGAQDYQEATHLYASDLSIAQQLAPTSILVGGILNDLGTISFDRGDVPRAEQYYLEALKIIEKWLPSSEEMATVLNNLGTLRNLVWDFEEAQAYYVRSLKLLRHLERTSPKAAPSLPVFIGACLLI